MAGEESSRPELWTVRSVVPPAPPAASRATSGTFRGADAQRLGKQWPRAASGGEALQDLLAPPIGEPERDPAIEIDPLKHKRDRRVALRPPRIGQVLLRRVRDGARPQEEGAPAQPDDRFQCPEELAALVEHALFDDFVRPSQDRLRDFNADRLGGFEVDARASTTASPISRMGTSVWMTAGQSTRTARRSPAWHSNRSRRSVLIRVPGDHRAARARHPDAISLDVALEFAAVLVLLEDGPGGRRRASPALVASPVRRLAQEELLLDCPRNSRPRSSHLGRKISRMVCKKPFTLMGFDW
jgi:hypothetical protein